MRIYKTGKKFGVDFTWHGGRVRLVGYTTRRATEAFGRKLEALAACKEAGERPDSELSTWLEGLPVNIKEKLARNNLIDQQKLEVVKSLEEHIEDYSLSMRSKGNTELHAKREIAKIIKVFNYCNFHKLSDITLDQMQRYLNSRMEAGKKIRTINSDLVAMKTFCNWAVYVDRIPENPLSRLKKLKVSGECRRALVQGEYLKFLAATENGGAFRCMSGKDWALLFRLAAETGFRWNELRSLIRAQFHDLESENPSVSIKGEDTKNGRNHIQPLTKETSLLLRDHLALRLPTAKAFDMPASDCGAKVVRHYLKLADIDYIDSRGLKFDFHALRGQLASTLARSGVSPTIAHKVMRHSDINMTLKYYTHLSRKIAGKLSTNFRKLKQRINLNLRQAPVTQMGTR